MKKHQLLISNGLENRLLDALDIQTSAHGHTARAKIADKIYWEKPHKKVASGQSAVFYEEDTVVGSGIVSKL